MHNIQLQCSQRSCTTEQKISEHTMTVALTAAIILQPSPDLYKVGFYLYNELYFNAIFLTSTVQITSVDSYYYI